MFALLTNLIPLVLGFIGKMMSMRSQDKADEQKLILQALSAKNNVLESARKYDTPASAGNRRAILWFLISVIFVFVVGYAVFDVPIYVEQITPSSSYLFGLFETKESVDWIKIEGIPAFDKVFGWMTMIIEFWFGAQVAKRN